MDQAIAVNHRFDIDVHRAPATDQNLVARPQCVVRRHRGIGQGLVTAARLSKESGTVQRQRLAGTFQHEFLKIVGWQGLWILIAVENLGVAIAPLGALALIRIPAAVIA